MESGPNPIKEELAFPFHEPCEPPEVCNTIGHSGMTLRDYFAAKALGGILADITVRSVEFNADIIARKCFTVADAMLKAREGK